MSCTKKIGCLDNKLEGDYLVEVKMHTGGRPQYWDTIFVDTINVTCLDGKYKYNFTHLPVTGNYVGRTMSFVMQERYPDAYKDGSYDEKEERKAKRFCNFWLVSEYNKEPEIQLRNDSLFYSYLDEYKFYRFENVAKGKRIN
jgi:hypothetical protein